MFSYLQVVLVILLMGSILESITRNNIKKRLTPLYLLFAILLWIASGLRYGDNDYIAYVQAYKHGSDYMELGYQAINRMSLWLGISPALFFLLFASVTVGTSAIFIFRFNPRYAITGLLIYFCHAFLLRDMMQIRAALAIAGCMLSIPYIEKRDIWKTSVSVILMGSIHFVAWFWFLVYIAYPILKGRKRRILLVLLLSLLVGSTLNLAFFETLSQRLDIRALNNYVIDTSNNYTLGLTNPVLLKHLVIIAILLLKYDFFKQNLKYFEVMLVAYVIAAVFLSAFNSFAILAGRVGTLFSNVEHILIPSLLLLPKRGKSLFWLAIAVYCVIVFYSKTEFLQGLDFVTEHPYFLNHG